MVPFGFRFSAVTIADVLTNTAKPAPAAIAGPMSERRDASIEWSSVFLDAKRYGISRRSRMTPAFDHAPFTRNRKNNPRCGLLHSGRGEQPVGFRSSITDTG